MKRILAPTESPRDWKRLLAEPDQPLEERGVGDGRRRFLGGSEAILTGRQLHAANAVMLVQSFSPESRWLDDFQALAAAIGVSPAPGTVAKVPGEQTPALYVGWCAGDQRHRAAAL